MSNEHADTYVVTKEPVIAAEPSPAPEPVVETKQPVEAADPADGTTDAGGDGAGVEQEPKPKPGSQKQKEARIRAEQMAQQAWQEAQEARAQAAQFQREIAEIKAQINPQNPVDDDGPKLSEYDDFDLWQRDLAKWSREQGAKAARAELESLEYQRLEQQARQANHNENSAWQSKLAEAVGDDETRYNAANAFSYAAQYVERVAPAVAEAGVEFIKHSAIGPELVIAIGGDPMLVQRLVASGPEMAKQELKRLEDSILATRNVTTTKEHKPTTKAPAPVAPVSSAPNSASIATKRYDSYIVS